MVKTNARPRPPLKSRDRTGLGRAGAIRPRYKFCQRPDKTGARTPPRLVGAGWERGNGSASRPIAKRDAPEMRCDGGSAPGTGDRRAPRRTHAGCAPLLVANSFRYRPAIALRRAVHLGKNGKPCSENRRLQFVQPAVHAALGMVIASGLAAVSKPPDASGEIARRSSRTAPPSPSAPRFFVG